jgi:hypothetical protein
MPCSADGAADGCIHSVDDAPVPGRADRGPLAGEHARRNCQARPKGSSGPGAHSRMSRHKSDAAASMSSARTYSTALTVRSGAARIAASVQCDRGRCHQRGRLVRCPRQPSLEGVGDSARQDQHAGPGQQPLPDPRSTPSQGKRATLPRRRCSHPPAPRWRTYGRTSSRRTRRHAPPSLRGGIRGGIGNLANMADSNRARGLPCAGQPRRDLRPRREPRDTASRAKRGAARQAIALWHNLCSSGPVS